MLDRIYLY